MNKLYNNFNIKKNNIKKRLKKWINKLNPKNKKMEKWTLNKRKQRQNYQ